MGIMGKRKAYVPVDQTTHVSDTGTSYVEDTARVRWNDDSSVMDKKGAKTALSIGGVISALAAAAPLLAKSDTVKDAAKGARDNTAKGVDAGVDKAASAGQSAAGAVGTANDKMHDMIESLLGTISSKLDNLPDKKDEMLKGTPLLKDSKVADKKKGKAGAAGLIGLGMLALAGAGAAYMMSQQKKNDDPWAVADEDLATVEPRSTQGDYPAQVVTTSTTDRRDEQPRTLVADGQNSHLSDTGVVRGDAGGVQGTVDENLMINHDVARPNDTLNPNPQGYDRGIDNNPDVDNYRRN